MGRLTLKSMVSGLNCLRLLPVPLTSFVLVGPEGINCTLLGSLMPGGIRSLGSLMLKSILTGLKVFLQRAVRLKIKQKKCL